MQLKKNKKKTLIRACYSIENELSLYKLHVNMIPEISFNVNLRTILLNKEWDILRKAVYEKYLYKCAICGKENVKLEAHEKWEYMYEKSMQRLVDIMALCKKCHLNKHLGYAGNLDYLVKQDIIQHWCSVNGKSKQDFQKYFMNVYGLFQLRNKFKWVIVDPNNKPINKVKLKDLFKFLKLNKKKCSKKIVKNSTPEIQNIKDIEQIHGIGPKLADKLREHGVLTSNNLIENRNVEDLAQKTNINITSLHKFKLKAESIEKNEIYQISPFTIPDKKIIYIDIETDMYPAKRIWLISLGVDGKFKQFYADTWEQQKDILYKFKAFLKKNPNTLLLSFSGNNFDFRLLKNAMVRFGLNIDELTSLQHIDLNILLKRSFIFPIQRYSVKDLGKLFGYPFKHTHLDGFNVAFKYIEHIKKGIPLEKEILEYGEDDVKVLPFLIEKISNEKKIIKKNIPGLVSVNYTTEINGDLNILLIKVRNLYEQHGSLSIREDKRSNSIKAEIRFYAEEIHSLDYIRRAMATLLFREASPYQYKSGNRCYIPYYGRDQVIKFIQTIKPRKKNDISKLV